MWPCAAQLVYNIIITIILSISAPIACDFVAWGTSWYDFQAGRPGYHGASHVLTNETDYADASDTNYWVAGTGKSGVNARLFLYLGGQKTVSGFYMKNTRSAQYNNVGTKKFTIFASATPTGPWTDSILTDTLSNVINIPVGEIEVIRFPIKPISNVKYVMFQVDSFYATAGGLQYFAIF